MRKFITLVLLGMLGSFAPVAAQDAAPAFAARRFTAAIGIKHEWENQFRGDKWENQFNKAGWKVEMPMAYKTSDHTYLTGSAGKYLERSDWRFTVGWNWRFIAAGGSTWKQ